MLLGEINWSCQNIKRYYKKDHESTNELSVLYMIVCENDVLF